MNDASKTKIQNIINVFETGSSKGDYGNVSIFNDGPNGIDQITFGKSQTTEFGNLKILIQKYIDNKGIYADYFSKYISKIGKISSLHNNTDFVNHLKLSAKDPIMVETQDVFFDEIYWNPAKQWFTDHGFKENLSMLVIYDSFIHSGGILKFLRNRFSEKPPINGGDEKKWIERYVETRHQWLKHHSKPILRKTVYRTRDIQRALDAKDWELKNLFNANGVIVG